MSVSRVVTTCLAVAVVSMSWCSAAHAGSSLWPRTKGEICLSDTTTPDEDIVRFAVLRTVGEHYLVHGYVMESSGRKTLINGNAIVDNDVVMINISASGYKELDGEVWGSIGRLELDAGTLAGWSVGVSAYCVGDPASDDCALNFDAKHEMVRVACP